MVGTTSEWITIVSGVTEKRVESSSVNPIHKLNVLAGGEQTICMPS